MFRKERNKELIKEKKATTKTKMKKEERLEKLSG